MKVIDFLDNWILVRYPDLWATRLVHVLLSGTVAAFVAIVLAVSGRSYDIVVDPITSIIALLVASLGLLDVPETSEINPFLGMLVWTQLLGIISLLVSLIWLVRVFAIWRHLSYRLDPH